MSELVKESCQYCGGKGYETGEFGPCGRGYFETCCYCQGRG